MFFNLSDYNDQTLIHSSQNPVYRIKNNKTEKFYALKKIKRNIYSEHICDFEEIMNLINFKHQNIINIYGYNLKQVKEKGKNTYLTLILMEYIENNMVDEILSRQMNKNYFTYNEIIKFIKQLVSVLTFLQEEKFCSHRDLVNILKCFPF